MADGYISQIKTPDNKVYLLKDSEKTDEKVAQVGNAEDKDFPIILKNTNDTTDETANVKYSNNTTTDATTTKPFTFNPSTGTLKVTQIKIGTKDDSKGLFPVLSNWNQIGASNLYWYRSYINNYYGSRSHVDNWDSGKNIGTAATASAAATLGTVNFYNTAAAGATQTKTLLTADSTTNSNITITLPKTTGTLALKSELPTLSGLGGIGTITASGTAPLTLNGSKSGTAYTLTGSIADASASASGVVNTDAQTFGGTKTFNGGMHIYGSVSMSGSTVTNMYSGGAYHAGHNSLVLHGDSAGVSGIGFTSQKATDSSNAANINSPSDRAFIQYHAYGVTAAAEGNAPTLATSGELGTLVIGVGNDATDTIRLQAPSTAGILHQIGTTAYPIPHTTNTNGTVGGTTTPVYVEAGVIKAGTALKDLAYIAKPSSNTTTTFLRGDGTWQTALTSHQSLAAYAKLASPAFTGTPTAPTAANGTSTTQIATTEFVNNTLSYINAMRFKGTLGTGGTITALPASHEAGDTYRVITAGTWAGKYCEVGTLIICVKDSTAAADADWTAVETNEDGAIIGPSSSTANQIAKFSSGTGRVITNSGITIDDSDNLTIPLNFNIKRIEFNMGTSPIGAGWRRICKVTALSRYQQWFLSISGIYSSASPTGALIGISSLHQTINPVLLSCTNGSHLKKVRFVCTSGNVYWLDVYCNEFANGDNGAVRTWGNITLSFWGNVEVSEVQTSREINTSTGGVEVALRTLVDEPTFTLQDNDGTNSTTSIFTHQNQTLKLPATIKANLTGNATNVTGTVAIGHGGTGKTTALAAATALGAPYLLVSGTEITASSNLDSGYKAMGTYYSPDSTRTNTLAGTVPVNLASGFKLITAVGYRAATLRQFLGKADNDLYYRSSQDTGATWTRWYKLVMLPSGTDSKTFAAIGGATTPVYVNANGVITACTSYANASVNYATSAGSATSATTAAKLSNTSAIGGTDRPVYFTSDGIPEQTTYRMAGTNAAATTGLTYSNNLDTGIWYVKGITAADNPVTPGSTTDGVMYANKYDNNWIHEIYGDYRTGQIAVRGKNNGTWQAWRKILDSSNYTDYTVTKTGTGASGTWGISITGSAGSVAWANTGHPSTFPPTIGTTATTAMAGNTTVTNVSFTSASDNAEYPILMKNSTAGTTTAAGVKFNTGVTINPSESSITATEFIGNIKANKIIPTLQKTYTGNYYGTGDNYDSTSFFFISLKPDTWYKPWKIKFKIRSYCPAHTECDSVTYGLYTGRLGSYSYANWNERNDSYAHYYTSVRTLNQTGFNAGLSHALGICIRYSSNYTNTGWPRTFEVEIYDYEGCTVSLLDTPLLWANWPNAANHYNGWSVPDAVTRGLCETNDATGNNDDRTLQDIMYFRFKSGAAGIGRYTLLMEESTGVYSSLTTTFPSSNTPLTTLTMNTGVKYKLGRIIYFNQGVNRAGNTNIANDNQYFTSYSLIDGRYTFQYAAGALTGYKPFYMVGTLDENGFFTIDPAATAWAQDLPTANTNKVYVFLGTVYPDTNAYRIALELDHPVYTFTNGALKQINPGNISGNAETATAIQTAGTTAQFYRGDNSWSNILKQTAASALGIDTNLKIGTAIKDLHFSLGKASGSDINSGNGGGITFGADSSSYGGIYWQTSSTYGSRLHFATTGSFANGAYTRMLITHDGKVGIGTLSPDKLLTVNGEIKGTALYLRTAASNPSTSAGARIEFSYYNSASDNGQPVYLHYCPNDSYRAPAGLKVFGGTGATPAWFEVEGNVYAAAFKGNADTASRINGNLGAVSSATACNIWVSSTNSADGIPKYVSGVYVTASTGVITAKGFSGPLTGNVTGNVSGSSGSCTGNAATASKIAAKLATTTKTFLLGTSTTITGTAANVELIGDTGIYATTTAGQLNATSYKVNEKVTLQWNSTDSSLDFIFA